MHTKVFDSICAENGCDEGAIVRGSDNKGLPLPRQYSNTQLNKMSEKNRAAILELMKTPGNNTCADCGAPSKSFKLMISRGLAENHCFVLYFDFSIDFRCDFL